MIHLLEGKNLLGLIASLGCLLIVLLIMVMLNDWDRPKRDREHERAALHRGLFDDRSRD